MPVIRRVSCSRSLAARAAAALDSDGGANMDAACAASLAACPASAPVRTASAHTRSGARQFRVLRLYALGARSTDPPPPPPPPRRAARARRGAQQHAAERPCGRPRQTRRRLSKSRGVASSQPAPPRRLGTRAARCGARRSGVSRPPRNSRNEATHAAAACLDAFLRRTAALILAASALSRPDTLSGACSSASRRRADSSDAFRRSRTLLRNASSFRRLFSPAALLCSLSRRLSRPSPRPSRRSRRRRGDLDLLRDLERLLRLLAPRSGDRDRPRDDLCRELLSRPDMRPAAPRPARNRQASAAPVPLLLLLRREGENARAACRCFCALPTPPAAPPARGAGTRAAAASACRPGCAWTPWTLRWP